MAHTGGTSLLNDGIPLTSLAILRMIDETGLQMRALSGSQIRSLLPIEKCISLMRDAMREVSQGRAALPLRHAMPIPNGRGLLGLMYGGMCVPDYFGIKLVSLFPGNRTAGISTHMGLFVLYESQQGKPVAIMDASTLTGLRTAAASAVATDALARADSSVLTILGTGQQASDHIPAMLAVRKFREIRVWGRSQEHARAFVQQHRDCGCKLIVSIDIADAVSGADVVCTVTSAAEPILTGDAVSPGTHLNVVGSSVPSAAEVDTQLVARSRFFCDYRGSAVVQAGELLRAIREGAIDESHIVGEVGDVLAGRIPGRRNAQEITLYKSLGVIAQDIVAAASVFAEAESRGIGGSVSI